MKHAEYLRAPTAANPADAPLTAFAAIVQTPVFPKTLHQIRPVRRAAKDPMPPKQDNLFSKSRGARDTKTSYKTQSFPHVR